MREIAKSQFLSFLFELNQLGNFPEVGEGGGKVRAKFRARFSHFLFFFFLELKTNRKKHPKHSSYKNSTLKYQHTTLILVLNNLCFFPSFFQDLSQLQHQQPHNYAFIRLHCCYSCCLCCSFRRHSSSLSLGLCCRSHQGFFPM